MLSPRTSILACILGAAATVATAWLLEILREGREPQPESWVGVREEHVWPAPVPKSWPSVPQVRASFPWFGGRVTIAHAQGPGPAGADHHGQEVRAYGFPLPALQSENNMSDVRVEPWTWRRGIWYAPWEPEFSLRPSALPLVPCWPGVLVDTMFYASIALLARPAFKGLRGRSRRRRGLCAACAYQVGHAGGACSECGTVARSVGRQSN